MNAKAYLKQVEKWDAMIKNKMIEKNIQLDIALSVTAHSEGERVQSSGSQQKMADATDCCVDIDRQIERLKAQKAEAIANIEMLPVAEYDILFKVYIQQMDLAEAAEATKGKSYSWATTVHGRALRNLQKILDEKAK